MKHHIVIYFTANPLSDKILFLKLWVKMLMANHIENLLKCISQERSVISIKIPYRKILLFWCGWPGLPKVPKVTKLENLGKKEVRNKFNFLQKIRIKVSLKQIPWFLVAIIMPKVPKTTCLSNIFAASL